MTKGYTNVTLLLVLTCVRVEANCYRHYGYYNGWYWDAWSAWSSCDHTCGGGVRTRSAYCWDYTLQQNILKYDNDSCGQNCFNHGTFINGKCQCRDGSKGRCCEVMPVCYPTCENNGTCIANDICKCKAGYYGQRCEIGSSFNELLLPKLHPTIPLESIHKQLSWYDRPGYDSSNEVCYVKVHIQNALYDLIFTAESMQSNSTMSSFGNFTTAPIDESAGINGSSRFACLQVRCPGYKMNQEEFDVLVRVSVKTRYKQCHVRYAGKKAMNFSKTSSQTESDMFTVVLENGKKYGLVYGVYFYTGFRDKAQYLAQHACQSGHEYDFDNIIPTNGILAEYIC